MEDTLQEQLRHAIRTVLDEHRSDPASISREIGRSKDYIRDFLEGRKNSLSASSLLKIEKIFHLNPGALFFQQHQNAALEWDKDFIIATNLTQDRSDNDIFIPVYHYTDMLDGTLLVDNKIHSKIPSPYIVSKSTGAYGIIVEGEIMSPAYDPGDVAIVNPNLGFRSDSDVLLFKKDETDDEPRFAAIRRIVGYDQRHWRVIELNPTQETTLSRESWPRFHRIVGKFARF